MISLSIALIAMAALGRHGFSEWLRIKALGTQHIKRLEAVEAQYAELLADARREGSKEALTKAYKR